MRSPSSLIRGFAAGALATVGMTGLMFAGRRLGLLGRMPPERITSRLLDTFEIGRSRRQQDVAAAALHVGFGGAAGSLFDLLYDALDLRISPLLQGAAFGTGVWAVSYAGWLPALQILPPPSRDRPGRPQVMLAAHWMYGALLGWLCSRARSARRMTPVAGGGEQTESGPEDRQ